MPNQRRQRRKTKQNTAARSTFLEKAEALREAYGQAEATRFLQWVSSVLLILKEAESGCPKTKANYSAAIAMLYEQLPQNIRTIPSASIAELVGCLMMDGDMSSDHAHGHA